jgi:hypothetical protein
MGTVSFTEIKRPGRGVDHPPPSSPDVKERVELFLCSPYGPSWLVPSRITFTFYKYKYNTVRAGLVFVNHDP